MEVDVADEGAVKHRETVIKWALASQHRSRIDNACSSQSHAGASQ